MLKYILFFLFVYSNGITNHNMCITLSRYSHLCVIKATLV